MATRVYSASRKAGVRENRVIVRMLQIAREDLDDVDDDVLRRILREPLQGARELPALANIMPTKPVSKSEGFVINFNKKGGRVTFFVRHKETEPESSPASSHPTRLNSTLTNPSGT
jgi:hypothetical protein